MLTTNCKTTSRYFKVSAYQYTESILFVKGLLQLSINCFTNFNWPRKLWPCWALDNAFVKEGGGGGSGGGLCTVDWLVG